MHFISQKAVVVVLNRLPSYFVSWRQGEPQDPIPLSENVILLVSIMTDNGNLNSKKTDQKGVFLLE